MRVLFLQKVYAHLPPTRTMKTMLPVYSFSMRLSAHERHTAVSTGGDSATLRLPWCEMKQIKQLMNLK
jgi:hypothetical protein